MDHHVPAIAAAYKKARQHAEHISQEDLEKQIRFGGMRCHGVQVVIQKVDPAAAPTAKTIRRSL